MKQESGRSMIEMLGVLAIMGLITVGSIGLLRLGMDSQKRGQVIENVVTIVTQVRQLLGEYDDFSNINNATIFGAIGVSNKNPYGGTYTLNVDPSNPRQFIVGITGLSESNCEFLVTRAWVDSVGYQMSGGKQSGASGDCHNSMGNNTVQITYGE